MDANRLAALAAVARRSFRDVPDPETRHRIPTGNIVLGFTVEPEHALQTLQSSVVELQVMLVFDGCPVRCRVRVEELIVESA